MEYRENVDLKANTNFIERFHQLFNESVNLRKQFGIMPVHQPQPGLSSASDVVTLLPETASLEAIYNPTDNNFWMYSMIVIGCAFVVFAIGSIYLLCVSGRQDNNNYRTEKFRKPSVGLAKPKRRQQPYQGTTAAQNLISKQANNTGRRMKCDEHSPLD